MLIGLERNLSEIKKQTNKKKQHPSLPSFQIESHRINNFQHYEVQMALFFFGL